ncbi:MAG: phage terminase small subunit [Eubacteriaceae bacterium]|jgi:phage terminase small subunit|nr:phage terminase small subunit [Eubacteriaceae bacterium]MDK2936988.1 phage terminase small subunit [Eubacteriaceae bacterium]MDK2961949.1 phage terminase small subunit [Eubacteriaceae bacterium]
MIKDIDKEMFASVDKNPDLTDKQRLFCLYYVRTFNATKSYQNAYGSNYAQANAHGSRLLINGSIKSEIQKLIKMKMNSLLIGTSDIFVFYWSIAFSDMTDFLSFDESGVYLNASEEVDGRLISELAISDNGIKVKLLDRMKALQWLSDHMDLATTEQRARIEKMNSQIEQIKTSSGPYENDGFIEALKSEVK